MGKSGNENFSSIQGKCPQVIPFPIFLTADFDFTSDEF